MILVEGGGGEIHSLGGAKTFATRELKLFDWRGETLEVFVVRTTANLLAMLLLATNLLAILLLAANLLAANLLANIC